MIQHTKGDGYGEGFDDIANAAELIQALGILTAKYGSDCPVYSEADWCYVREAFADHQKVPGSVVIVLTG